jgi:hypothetical protein
VEDGFLPEDNRKRYDEEAKQQTIAGAFIVFGIAMLVLAGSWLPQTIAIMSGGGVYGTYTVENPTRRCNRNSCDFLRDGTFRSDDGNVVLTDVEVGYPPRTTVREGDTFRAFSVGEALRVHTEEDRDDVPMPQIFVTLVGLVGVVHGSLWLRRIRKAKRPGA